MTRPAVRVLERFDPPRQDVLGVLTYHRVALNGERPFLYPGLVSASPPVLRQQLEELGERFRFISADELLEARRRGTRLPPRSLLVTFDDAYQDFAEHAWPTLRGLGIPVVLFVPTGYPDRRADFWWDRIYWALMATNRREPLRFGQLSLQLDTRDGRERAYRAVRDHLKSVPHGAAMAGADELEEMLGRVERVSPVLGWQQLRQLASEGVRLAPHTRTHPLLDRVSPTDAMEEMRGSIDDLEREVGSALPILAYPSGHYNQAVIDGAIASGIEIAFTTQRGANDLRRPNWHQLRRINVGRRSTTELLRAQLLGLTAR